jgi:hypothetical protein
MEVQGNKYLSEETHKELIKIIRKYLNLYKSLHFIDPAVASEFKKKQELYHLYQSKENKNEHSGNCCESKLNHQSTIFDLTLVFIPKDKQNNIEKNLSELLSTFFYEVNIVDLLENMNEKYEKIVRSGINSGLILDDDTEKQLIHRLMLEGVPHYLSEKLRKKLISYEESISEAPMLLAHPSGVHNQDLLEFLPSKNLEMLIKNNFTHIDNKFYSNM